jgi:hypothetical protein
VHKGRINVHLHCDIKRDNECIKHIIDVIEIKITYLLLRGHIVYLNITTEIKNVHFSNATLYTSCKG